MSKDYKKWSELKLKINDFIQSDRFHVNAGEIWWCAFGENIGIEIDGKRDEYLRPALVIKFFNKNHVWILPLTTQGEMSKFNIKITSFSDSSFVVVSQLRTVSSLRLARYIARISKDDFVLVNESIIDLLKYETPEQVGGISRPL